MINLWKKKRIRFEPNIDESQISLCSIDLKLGNNCTNLEENPGITVKPSISKAAGLFKTEIIEEGKSLKVKAHSLVLATTYEKITLPNNIAAMVEGRSTYARWGLSAHVTAPLINPGWNGNITLEMYNHSSYDVELIPGKDRVCQLILYRITSPIPKNIVDNLSRYRGQTTPHPQPYNSK